MSTVRVRWSSRSIAKRMRSCRACCVVGLGFILITAALAHPAAAITINGIYTAEGDDPPHDENPWWDPEGTILKAHFEAAADIWEELLYQGATVYTIDFEWDDNISGLGLWSQSEPTDNNLIEIHPYPGLCSEPPDPAPDRGWYLDSAPWDHDEFNFTNPVDPDPTRRGQTLYRNLTPQQQADWFPGSAPIPDVLEVGFRGQAAGDTAERCQYDLLSVLLHEIGHELGISREEPGDYNIDPQHLGGTQDVLVVEDPGFENGHLGGEGDAPWLMTDGGSRRGVRRFPSATDILVIAEDQGISDVYLARVDRMSDGSWQNSQGWIGDRVPNELVDVTYSPDVFVRHGGTVSLGADTKVKSLLTGWASTVRTQNHTLTVTGGPTIVSWELLVDSNGHVELDQLDINEGGDLTMLGGTAKIWEGLNINLSSGSPSTIRGHGYVEVAQPLVNNGVIRADGGTLAFGYGGLSPTPLDLDGALPAEYGEVQAIDGDLFFGAGLTDAFDGEMWISEGRTITMAYDGEWTLGPDGVLKFNTDPPNSVPATLDGSQSTVTIVRGAIRVDGLGVIDTTLRFNPEAEVYLEGNHSRLRLNRQTIYEGGSYTGDGMLRQWGSAVVDGSTTIATRAYDWDGDETNPSETRIKPDVTFTIDSPDIDAGADIYDGVIINQGGILVVNTKEVDKDTGLLVTSPWTLNVGAQLFLKNADKPPWSGAELRGSPIDVAGQIIARGGANRIKSDVIFRSTADVQVPLDIQLVGLDELYLDGATEYRGGSFTGDGVIHQYGNATFTDYTKIVVDTFDWDGDESAPSTTSIGDGVKVWIRSDQIDSDGTGYGGQIEVRQGTLIVNTGDFDFPNLIFMPWRLDQGGSIDLADFAVLSGSGNDLFPENPGSRMFVAGDINVSGPGNVIYSLTTFESQAEVQIASGGMLTLAAETTYEGGSYSGDGILVQQGDALVRQPTTIDVSTFDMDGPAPGETLWTLDDHLTLNVGYLNLSDNTFDGAIRVPRDASLTVNLALGEPCELAGLIHVEGTEVVEGSTIPATFEVDGAPVKLNCIVDVKEGNTLIFY